MSELHKNNNMIVVTGQPRCGTSMMMYCLSLTGLNLAFEDVKKDSKLKAQFRNPYGFFEGRWNEEDGIVKCLAPMMLKKFKEPKLIMMTRDVDSMIESWNEIHSKQNNPNIRLEKRKQQIGEMRAKLLEEIQNYPHIIVNYDEFVNNPEKYRTQFEDFDIDFDKLIKGIDKKIYSNRIKNDRESL